MKLATPSQMNRLDSLAINKIGIPGIVLMENAALKVVEEIAELLGTLRNKNIIVFAGKGNNGGDAFAAARHLHNNGADLRVYLTAPKQAVTGDAGTNLNILSAMGIPVIEITGENELEEARSRMKGADVIVDGLLGTGIKGEVRGTIKAVIDIVNESGKAVVSIDMPSGIDGENGKICGCSITARKTVSFGLPKIGQVVHPGCGHTGELVIADIGIPQRLIDELNLKANLIDDTMAAEIIPLRSADSNKGSYGRVLVVSGSVGMTGAGCLTAEAAFRTGAGLVYLGVPASLSSVYDASLLESVTIPLEDMGTGRLARESTGGILSRLERMTVAVVGPGLSVNDEIADVVSAVVENSRIPLIMDADALNAISRDVSVLKKRNSAIVITPHPGEMARLAGTSTEAVQNDRIGTASDFAAKWGVITVLKGSRTIIACPDGSVYINATGNSGMATGGTGDALAGIVAGLIGQGAAPEEAAIAGVYIHGKAGDKAAGIMGEYGMMAGDVVRQVPLVMKELINLR